jgi:two-component system chemotaxis response regulator CheY
MQPNKVLIVDDSKLMLKMYEVMLRQYPLLYASDGRQALERLHQHADVDLILLDTNMPNMNGAEFLQELRSSDELRQAQVIFVTSRDETETHAGADATIAKPFSAEELLAKIAAL